ncbi:MAG: DUF2490 domain-containing protein [Pseudomonadota bacterium]
MTIKISEGNTLTYTVFGLLACLLVTATQNVQADAEDELGLWNMYFLRANLGDSRWVAQADLQLRLWEVGADTEQIMRRGSIGYRPGGGSWILSGGFAYITARPFGDGGMDTDENRFYQEALIPQKVGRVALTHRIRTEQRWVDRQDFRTRYRYALFANIPLNRDEFRPGTSYLAFYNELFINGERDTGRGEVDYFDRNRLYAGVGYVMTDTLRLQVGVMRQDTQNLDRTQLQLGLHHAF